MTASTAAEISKDVRVMRFLFPGWIGPRPLSISAHVRKRRPRQQCQQHDKTTAIGRLAHDMVKRAPGDLLRAKFGGHMSGVWQRRSDLPLDQHLLDVGDRLGRVEAFGAGLGAVHDGVAAVQAERIFEIVEPVAGGLVAAVADPAIGLQQRRRAEIAVAVPPIARARGRAAGAQDALVQPVELLALVAALFPLLFRGDGDRLQPRLDRAYWA